MSHTGTVNILQKLDQTLWGKYCNWERATSTPAFFTTQRFVGEANCAFSDTLVRIWQRGERMNGCKTGKQRTKKKILTANLGKKGLASTRQINQPGCPWQRYNCQVFKFQIMMPVWVIKVAWSFCKNTSVACKTCWTAVTAGTSQPRPLCYLQRLYSWVWAADTWGIFIRRNRSGSRGSYRRTRS